MMIYSNVVAGVTVTLKFYNAATDSEYNSVVVFSFIDNGTMGSSSNPLCVENNSAPDDIMLSTSVVQGETGIGDLVLDLSAHDEDLSDTHTYSLVNGEGCDDNGTFTITGSSLYLAQLIYPNVDTLKLRIRVTDNNGCFYEEAFQLEVNRIVELPTVIFLSDSTFAENQSAPFVGTFSVIENEMPTLFVAGLWEQAAFYSIRFLIFLLKI